MRVLVVTVVHTPLDARIHHRQVAALAAAGHEVELAAPFTGHGVPVSSVERPGVRGTELPRAHGRRRGRALLAARRLIARRRDTADVILLHDPELLLAVLGLRHLPPVVWDVHEDLAGSLTDKVWLPDVLHAPVRFLVASLEALADRRVDLLLAEESYRARFRSDPPVVPNLPWLPSPPPPPGSDRVVYLGRVSRLRGGRELLALGDRLSPHGITVEVVGPVDEDLEDDYRRAAARGAVVAPGFVPNDVAVRRLPGALAGLSLLHDHSNYRGSMPTKVVEYQAAGVPVITTPLPLAERMVREAGSGVVVPFEDVTAVEQAVLALRADADRARELGRRGRQAAERWWSWDHVAPDFVGHLEHLAEAGRVSS